MRPTAFSHESIFLLSLLTVSVFGNARHPLTDDHRRWLEREVPYIIAARERESFLTLESDEARDAFIERFWEIRDPDSSTERNEYRIEHYRRIEEANQRFHDGKPGWKTERGRVFIRHGPPDDVNYIFGGDTLNVDVQKPTLVLTGGSADSGAFFRVELLRPEAEIWIYRRLEGASSFPTYFQVIFSRINPQELYDVHRSIGSVGDGSNLSYAARLQRDTAIARYKVAEHHGGEFRILYAGGYKYPDIDSFFQSIFHPNRPPVFDMNEVYIGLRDLERSPGDVLHEKLARGRRLREEVTTRISFEQFELDLFFGAILSDSGGTLLPVTFGLSPEYAGDTLELLVELVRPDGASAASLLDYVPIEPFAKKRGTAVKPSRQFLYQARLAARPGRYLLRVYGMLLQRQLSAFVERKIELPDYSRADVTMSDLLLFERVASRKSVRETEKSRFLGGSRPIVLKDLLLVPAADTRFRRRDKLTAFFEVYNPGIAPGAEEPSLNLTGRLWRGAELVASLPEKLLNYVTDSNTNENGSRRTTYGLSIPLLTFDPGEYSLELEVHDAVLNKNLSKRIPFKVY